MPCYDSGPRNVDGYDHDAHKKIQELQEKLDKVTQMLCEITQNLPLDGMSPELIKWAVSHRAFDEKRKIQEDTNLDETFKETYLTNINKALK